MTELEEQLNQIVSQSDKRTLVSHKEKKVVVNTYQQLLSGENFGTKFLNWGYWDHLLFKEYIALKSKFYKRFKLNYIYSQLLVFSLIAPLVRLKLFNKKILEIGCGNGVSLTLSSELLKSKCALGIDLTNNAIKNAHAQRDKNKQIFFVQGDAEILPVKSNSVDIVINLESSHLYPCLDTFFSEVNRVLTQGGFFCYADIYFKEKSQITKLKAYLKKNTSFEVILKKNITANVQSSIYKQLIVKEISFLNNATSLFNRNLLTCNDEVIAYAKLRGLLFLPWWRLLGLRSKILRDCIKKQDKKKLVFKKHYFYYLIQKN